MQAVLPDLVLPLLLSLVYNAWLLRGEGMGSRSSKI